MNSRATASNIITQVILHKKSLDDAFLLEKISRLTPRDQSFVRELCFGTLRFYERLLAIAYELLHKPLSRKNMDVLAILLVGLYQIIYLKTKPYAAISESVSAVKLKNKWAAGLINKTLRIFFDDQNKILQKVDVKENVRFSHPNWLLKLIKKNWPTHINDILTANNSKAPLFLRVNPHRISRDRYLLKLKAAEIPAIAIKALPYAIQLKEAVPVDKLPGFGEGLCYVQDIAGQFVTPLLQLAANQTVLDACAAPGSKTSDIIASCTSLKKLIAIDKDKSRLRKINENFNRLQLPQSNLKLLAADATDVKSWWDKEAFDRILIDAPCSATGVIRRHPDIKILRKPEDIQNLVLQQKKLLISLWPLLKTEGLLLYTTCSILKEENEELISQFLKHHPDATSLPITLENGIKQRYGTQLLPSINGSDGFYYALLVKKK